MTISLTPEAVDKAKTIAATLRKENPEIHVSVSDAFQKAILKYPLPRRKK